MTKFANTATIKTTETTTNTTARDMVQTATAAAKIVVRRQGIEAINFRSALDMATELATHGTVTEIDTSDAFHSYNIHAGAWDYIGIVERGTDNGTYNVTVSRMDPSPQSVEDPLPAPAEDQQAEITETAAPDVDIYDGTVAARVESGRFAEAFTTQTCNVPKKSSPSLTVGQNAPSNAVTRTTETLSATNIMPAYTWDGEPAQGFGNYRTAMRDAIAAGGYIRKTVKKIEYQNADGQHIEDADQIEIRTKILPLTKIDRATFVEAYQSYCTKTKITTYDEAEAKRAYTVYRQHVEDVRAGIIAYKQLRAATPAGERLEFDDETMKTIITPALNAGQAIFRNIPQNAGMPRGYRFRMRDLTQVADCAGQTLTATADATVLESVQNAIAENGFTTGVGTKDHSHLKKLGAALEIKNTVTIEATEAALLAVLHGLVIGQAHSWTMSLDEVKSVLDADSNTFTADQFKLAAQLIAEEKAAKKAAKAAKQAAKDAAVQAETTASRPESETNGKSRSGKKSAKKAAK